MGQIVYHYTDAHGLDGILRKRELWMSDLRYMNDPNELSFGADRGMKLIDGMLEALPARPEDEVYPDNSYDPLTRRQVLVMARRSLEHVREWANFFAVSFCESGDLLSQWRSYAGMAGFAIGFDLGELALGGKVKNRPVRDMEDHCNLSESWRCITRQVTYSSAESNDLEQELQAKLVQAQDAPYDLMAANYFAWDLFPTLAGYKSRGFEEEQEWRLFTQMPYHYDDEGRDGEVHVRVGRDGLLPYVKLWVPPSAIQEIVMGPGHRTPALTRRAVKQYGLLDDQSIKESDTVVFY